MNVIDEFLKEISAYGKVDTFRGNNKELEIKLTEGFSGLYEPTMKVGEIIMKYFPEYKHIKKAHTDVGLCHYIFGL